VKFVRKGIWCNRIKDWRNGTKREKHVLLLMQKMGVKTQDGGPQLLVFKFPSWGH
jgi:hypothetical protein